VFVKIKKSKLYDGRLNGLGVINNKDDQLEWLAANGILSHFFEHKVIEGLKKRLAAIEQKLSKIQ